MDTMQIHACLIKTSGSKAKKDRAEINGNIESIITALWTHPQDKLFKIIYLTSSTASEHFTLILHVLPFGVTHLNQDSSQQFRPLRQLSPLAAMNMRDAGKSL